ncbi:MAG: arsenite methyltransferase [Actinobacteria bacterium]|nr:arsenite methyltransferase [Actinomycetota bacterium]
MTFPDDTIRIAVRDHYAEIARTETGCCAPAPPSHSDASCCTEPEQIGYDPADLAGLPDEAIMGLGCGNPVALAGITEGEIVVDLGSGGGIDVFLAARKAGAGGRVIGVDMTPEMVERAERNATRAGLENVEFRLGLIEDLPIEDGTVDVILSNCVINLAPDKAPVFSEAFRVLRPGGRIVVSDIVRSGPAPAGIDPRSWSSCVDGALALDDYLEVIAAAGFEAAEVLRRDGEGSIFSATVRAFKGAAAAEPPPEERRACACGC